MAARILKRLTSGFLPAAVLFTVLLVSFTLMGDATQNSEKFNRLFSLLLLINGLGLIILLVLIATHLSRLVRQYRSGAAGSRLTVRLVVMFVLLSVLPVSTVYYFSVQFLNRGIESWFDVRIDQALDSALALSQASLDLRMRELLNQGLEIADELVDVPDEIVALRLNEIRGSREATEPTLTSQGGSIIATSTTDQTAIVPNRPDDEILMQIRQGSPYVGLDPIPDLGLHVRVVTEVQAGSTVLEPRVVQSLFPIPERIGELADQVQSTFGLYKELVYLRKPLKYSFTLTLSLILLLSVLSAVWAAFFSSRRMVAPIRDLAEGTRAVAAGDYSKRLPLSGADELGFLVESFNEMTERLDNAREETRLSQRLVEDQRAYLETVLRHLSSGVISVSGDCSLRTANSAAEQILGVELSSWVGKSLEPLAEDSRLKPFVEMLVLKLKSHSEEWHQEVSLSGERGHKLLMCQGTSLPGSEASDYGCVLVFDDISELVRAQRDAAWGEVARRLAHEIKNPLTPIKLSAERLRHKLMTSLEANQGELLDRYTNTIVQQVELMKEMVNAFSDYARAPQLQIVRADLNRLIEEVLDLYRVDSSSVTIQMELKREFPLVDLDPGRIRQVLNNLIKNALEAISETESPAIRVVTDCVPDNDCERVQIVVEDNGRGFETGLERQAFEPYVTTKQKGTGLGLAIVKKIVEEHHGTIEANNNESGGVSVIINLPARQAKEQTQSDPSQENAGSAVS